jgi:hypothetical protein
MIDTLPMWLWLSAVYATQLHVLWIIRQDIQQRKSK